MKITTLLDRVGWPSYARTGKGVLSWAGSAAPHHITHALVAVTDDHVTLRCADGPLVLPVDATQFDDRPQSAARLDAKWVVDNGELFPASMIHEGRVERMDHETAVALFVDCVRKMHVSPLFVPFVGDNNVQSS